MESEWAATNNAWKMLEVVRRSNPSERKVRLFNAAVCRRFWSYLPEASRAILEESETLADGLLCVSADELCTRANAVAPFDRQFHNKDSPSMEIRIQRESVAAVCYAVASDELYGAACRFWGIDAGEKTAHAGLIRDIFGNPFKPRPSLRDQPTPLAAKLAQAIYDSRAFDRLPMLAIALVQDGFPNQELVHHCRAPGPHVPGCWALDIVLGKQ